MHRRTNQCTSIFVMTLIDIMPSPAPYSNINNPNSPPKPNLNPILTLTINSCLNPQPVLWSCENKAQIILLPKNVFDFAHRKWILLMILSPLQTMSLYCLCPTFPLSQLVPSKENNVNSRKALGQWGVKDKGEFLTLSWKWRNKVITSTRRS